MTTILGIHGKDPETSLEYILLASDTRVSNIEQKFDNFEKIQYSNEGDCIYSYSGWVIEHNNIPEEILKEYKSMYSKHLDVRLSSCCTQIGEIAELNDFLFKKTNSVNDFIFAVNSGLYLVNSYVIGKVSHNKTRKYVVSIGSGSPFATERLEKKVPLTNYYPVKLSVQKSTKIAYEAIKYAIEKDECSGGRVDLALVQDGKKVIFRDIESLSKKNNNFLGI